MAVYELNIRAISNNSDVHTSLKSKIPDQLDARIWSNDYVVDDDATENDYAGGEGISTTSVSVRFNDSADRTTVINEINALANFKTNCLSGSYIKQHKCYHDEGLSCDDPVILWEKA